MAWAMVAGAAITVVGGAINAHNAKSGSGGQLTSTDTKSMDPRVASMLFGSGERHLKSGVTPTYGDPATYDQETGRWSGGGMTNPDSDYTTDGGLLSRYQGLLDTPQNSDLKQFGDANGAYLRGNGIQDMDAMRRTSLGLMNGGPQMQGANLQYGGKMYTAQIGGDAGKINAPAQNGLNLTGAYDKMINGDAGANPYLTKALQSGVDMTNASYQANQDSATNNLMRNVLPGIRSGAMAAGGYGGSREGIAEGNALGDYTKQLTNANLTLGLGNSANTTGQQATAFGQGQDRSLSAMSGLGAQQYGVATQDASNDLQREQMNAQLRAQSNMAQYEHMGAVDAANAGFQQDANKTNLLTGLDSTRTGMGALSGLLGTATGAVKDQDAYGLSRASQVNGLLSPYLGQVPGSSTSTQPLYSNTMGNLIGGATAGLGLYNAYQKANGGGYNYNTGGSSYYSNPQYTGNQLFNPNNFAGGYGSGGG